MYLSIKVKVKSTSTSTSKSTKNIFKMPTKNEDQKWTILKVFYYE